MAKTPIVKVTFVGDSTSAQKSVKDLAGAAAAGEVKLEGFGKAFLKLGAAIGGAALLKEGADAVADYSKKVKDAEIDIYALTKSQTAVAEAQKIANREMEAGRAAFSDTMAQLAALTPLANQSGQSIDGLYKTAQQLATLNSGPEGGVSGAIVAMGNALSGDWSSAIDRFNLPRQMINDLKAQGVPALEIFTRALAASGVTMDTVTAQAKKADVQQKILTDSIAKLGAEAGGQQGIDIWTTALIGLNKVAQSGAVKEFAERLNYLLQVAVSAEGFSQISIDVRKSIYLILYAFNDLLEGVSGGKLSLYKPLADMQSGIEDDEGKLRKTIQDHIGKPVAEETNNAFKPTTQQKNVVSSYGAEILLSYLKGMDSAQSEAQEKISGMFADLFKDGPNATDDQKIANQNKRIQAEIALAQALKETANGGQLSSDTMNSLSSAYGMQTPLVVQLIGAHNALTNAQNRQADAAKGLEEAQRGLQQVQNRAKGDLAGYEAAITSAQQAAAQHAQETADALEPLNEAMAGVRAAAEESGRAGTAVLSGLQGELEALQNQASANAASFQQQIATAQAAYEQAQTRRQQLQGLLQAALNGEVESYLRINDIQDESIRKIAEKWQAEIDGERRAKAGADDRVKGLTRAGNREELDYIEKIKAARLAGDTAEVRRLERARDASRKKRSAELEEAQARARVAGDEYDAAAEALTKEGKGQDEIEGKAEKAAAAEVTRIQTAATAQKAADDAAIAAKNDQIKRVQAAQQAEQERYAAQQRGIQAEIDATNRAAKAQAKKDADDLAAAQAAYTQRQTYWNLENTGAQLAVNLFGAFAQNTTTIANDSKASYDQLEKITKLDFQNVLDAAAAAKAMANQPPALPQTQSGTPLAPAPQNTPGQTEGQIGPPGAAPGAQGPANMPPLLEGAPGATPPPGYHSEVDNAGFFWFVPNGYSLLNYGKQQGPGANSGNSGDSTSMSAAGVGSPRFLRTAGVGGGDYQRADDPRGATFRDFNLILPNVRDLGSKEQREEIYAAMRRELSSATRGGLGGGKVDQG